jgi:hypothetical protein
MNGANVNTKDSWNGNTALIYGKSLVNDSLNNTIVVKVVREITLIVH